MKRIFSLFVVLLFVIMGCQSEADFEFSLSYDTNPPNYRANFYDEISTFDGTIILNTSEGSKIIDFRFDSEELLKIKDFIIENEILEEDYSDIPRLISSTANKMNSLKVLYNNVETEINWDSTMILSVSTIGVEDSGEVKLFAAEGYEREFEKVEKLIKLEQMILEIINDYKEVSDLIETQKE